MTLPDARPPGDAGPSGHGLELRWPTVMTRDGDPEAVVVDVVNEGDARWIPTGESLLAFGAITAPGAPPPGIAFAFAGGPRRAVALDPGDRTRVPVSIPDGDWAELEPGPHDVHAVLISPHVRAAEPLRVTITAEMIARRCAAVARVPRHDADAVRRSREATIAWLRARTAAGDALVALAGELARAASAADAVARIRALLDTDESTAQLLLGTPLDMLLPSAVAAGRRELADAEERRDASARAADASGPA
ncbi:MULTISPECIES: hypothetical protein [unclassified Clavibacter]|uniref:hypothetical protein n=1 Tax=unclassified Clavibacter TaxID=2626594 RepID=UPI0022EA9A6B|nr:hypothetical protein [Clavibacter sp. CT19]MDA3805833.1 hypothetical protein [Clavibacter sp. CT19]